MRRRSTSITFIYCGLSLGQFSSGEPTRLFPSWPWDWRAAVAGSPNYLAPVQRPGGFLLLLGLLRWRAPEGRLLGVLALVPHTTALHDMLAPLLAARTGRELAVLVGLGYLFAALAYTFTPHGPNVVPEMLAAQWPVALSLVYIPALVLVLRRPNAAPERDQA